MWGLVWDTMKWLALNISLQLRAGGQSGCTPGLVRSPAAGHCRLWLQLHLAHMQCWGSLQACIAHPSPTSMAAPCRCAALEMSAVFASSPQPADRQLLLKAAVAPAPAAAAATAYAALHLAAAEPAGVVQEWGCARQAFQRQAGRLGRVGKEPPADLPRRRVTPRQMRYPNLEI